MTVSYSVDTIGMPQIFQIKKGDIRMPNLKDLRKRAGWSVFDLASNAGVSISTVNRLESGKKKNAVSTLFAYKVLNTLSDKLGEKLTLENVENLHVKD